MHTNGAYDEFAPRMLERGLRPVPIGPGTKKPRVWTHGEYRDLPDWPTRPAITTPQPGAGIGVVLGDVVALDLDDDAIAVALLDILPDTPIRKVGQRGETLFYYAPELHSRKFRIDGRSVCEILARGSQTVLPPTVHPDTGQPYRWTGSKTLLDIAVTDLPRLPSDIVDRIEGVLTGFGYEPAPIHDDAEDEISDSPFRALNVMALKNLAVWVPELGIYGCRRRRGGGASYDAVATWRPSSSGKAVHERGRNLRISSKGIRDFGDGRGYTPIDLVMAALGCAFNDAVAFLDAKLGWSTGGPEVVIDESGAEEPKSETAPEEEKPQPQGDTAEAKQQGSTDDTAKPQEDPNNAGTQEQAKASTPPPKKFRFKLMAYADLRPGLEQQYLVDELLPIAGLVDVWGKAKCYKSFWCLDLMLHVAMGWEYRDRYVRQGAVVYCAFEGAHGYKKRVEAQRRHYNIASDTVVPLYVMPGQANLIKEHRLLISDIKAQLDGVCPVAVVLDTLNKSLVGSENKDEDMGAYVRAAEAIRDAFKCVVVIVHHCGYDDTRPRGHSSLPGAVDAQLAVVRTEEIITVTVERMRDGPEDIQVVSEAKVIEVGQDQNGKVLTSLVITPSSADAATAGRRGWPRGLSVFIRR
jgi:hypothetical protein